MPHSRVTYRQLLRFFLPLATTPLLIASIHSMMNSALARLPSPELSIAVFSVVKALANAIKAPDFMTAQVSVSLVDSRESFRIVMRFAWSLCAGLLAILLLLGYTPLGGWVFRRAMGLTEPEQLAFAYTSMRIVCFLPVVETLRNSYHGLVMGTGRTEIMAAGTAVRLVVISGLLFWAASTGAVSGIVIASVAWVGGIGLEGLFVVGSISRRFGSTGAAAECMPQRNTEPLSMKDVLGFFAPLGLMMVLAASLQPIVQAGIAQRAEEATRALATYGVVWGLVIIITGPLGLLHQCSLAYTTGPGHPNWRRVRRFCYVFGAAATGALLILALTPLGYATMHRAIGVSSPIAEAGRPVLVALALVPLALAWREPYWGVLMRRRSTSMIGVAKGANLVAALVSIAAGLPLLTSLGVAPEVGGAIALLVGEAVESLLIWYHARSAGPLGWGGDALT